VTFTQINDSAVVYTVVCVWCVHVAIELAFVIKLYQKNEAMSR